MLIRTFFNIVFSDLIDEIGTTDSTVNDDSKENVAPQASVKSPRQAFSPINVHSQFSNGEEVFSPVRAVKQVEHSRLVSDNEYGIPSFFIHF